MKDLPIQARLDHFERNVGFIDFGHLNYETLPVSMVLNFDINKLNSLVSMVLKRTVHKGPSDWAHIRIS
jgi:hypothetical protein